MLKMLPTMSKLGGENGSDDEMEGNYAGVVVCNNVRANEYKWILDSGATHHITGSKEKLCNLEKLSDCVKVDLPNGESVKVTHKGVVNLTSGVQLEGVMYVPSFTHNLVSIPKLIRENDCVMKFGGAYCIIYDKVTEEVMGVGTAENGLYVLQEQRSPDYRSKRQHEHRELMHQSVINTVKVKLLDVVAEEERISEMMRWH